MEKKYFELSPLDVDKFIKKNDQKEIKNPVFFIKDNIPTSDGLLSNDIFGITKYDRANVFGYISLGEWFMEPLFYRIWSMMDNNIPALVNGTKSFIIDNKGYLVEDENGKTGLKFLRANIDIIKIKTTESTKRDVNIRFIMENKKDMFINKFPVIPAYYRDVNTGNGSYVGVGEINEMYSSMLISVRALTDSADYGLNLSDAYRGRIQNTIQNIYNWLTGEPQLSKKMGSMRRSLLSKTTDYSSRLVMSAPQLRVEDIDDMQVDMDYAAIPLASLCANFYPFMMFNIRRFFENEFAGNEYYVYFDKDKKEQKIKIKDYQIAFSDMNIKKEMEKYMFGYSNRFTPISIPNEEEKNIFMRFKGYNVTTKEYEAGAVGTTPLIERDLCWIDVFMMAAIESVKDKCIIVTRYPVDTYFNQCPMMVNILSTKETEPMFYNNTFIKNYPKIRQENILQDTSNKFIDTANICNAYLKGYTGDYDGDQMSIKGGFSVETNEELRAFMQSKAHYIGLDAKNIRVTTNEGIQSLYNLTKILPDSSITNPVFKKK